MPKLENKARILVQVHPNAIKNKIVSLNNGVLYIRISAPPVKGKANQELVAFLSRLLGIKKDNISIVKGYTTRRKFLFIDGLNQESVLKLLLLHINT